MVVSAADIQDTLALLVPGFVATKVFYVFGLATKRNDTEWILWSILVSAPLAAAAAQIEPAGLARIVLAVASAVASGALVAAAWQLYRRRRPHAGAFAAVRAWDVIMGRREAPWVELEDAGGRRFLGVPQYPADSVETDDLDLYLTKPILLGVGGEPVSDLTDVEGILFSRSQINYLAVFKSPSPQPRPLEERGLVRRNPRTRS